MNGKQKTIAASCSFFVCKECRTKTGYEHQIWCGLNGHTKPDCSECIYRLASDGSCVHPARIIHSKNDTIKAVIHR